MYPFNNKALLKTHVEKEVCQLNLGDYKFDDVVSQILFIMDEIKDYLFSRIEDTNLFHESKYIRDKAGKPTCNFAKLCSNENWEAAIAVSDTVNKGFLKNTTVYQDYVHDIKTSTEYLSTLRNTKLITLLG